jgi:hypothetical protein
MTANFDSARQHSRGRVQSRWSECGLVFAGAKTRSYYMQVRGTHYSVNNTARYGGSFFHMVPSMGYKDHSLMKVRIALDEWASRQRRSQRSATEPVKGISSASKLGMLQSCQVMNHLESNNANSIGVPPQAVWRRNQNRFGPKPNKRG